MTTFKELADYSGINNLPEGLEGFYHPEETYPDGPLVSQKLLMEISERYELSDKELEPITTMITAIKGDSKLEHFTKFLVKDMCSSRNRCDVDNYTVMTPTCLEEGDAYSLVLLLACIEPSMKLLAERGVPKEHYIGIPHRMIEPQMKKLKDSGDVKVADFPWDMNFYTCAIFLFDRFLFIPYKFGDAFTMYRHQETKEVAALHHGGQTIRRDGQFDGINGVHDLQGRFETTWAINATHVTANKVNPMGYVESSVVNLDLQEWKEALIEGDMLLAWHIPSGPGYTPERLKTSMVLAMEFYETYFPEMPIKGFWSESWLYDTRLSLMLEDTSNIVRMQRQFYNYPINEGDAMLRYELFGNEDADPMKVELKTSLQRKAAKYMADGNRFNTLSMIILKDEMAHIGHEPYITEADLERYEQIVDSHLS